MRAVVLVIGFVLGLPAQGAQCSAQSGPGTAALVELYTSEGCSSCPPADRWLATLAPRAPGGSIVPLALHVHYGDYIGRPDRYAKRKLSPLQRMALVYTPQVLLQGRDFRPWGGRDFDDAVARINSQPARAHLRLEILSADKQALEVHTKATLGAPSQDAVLYMAAYRKGPESGHDYVVLEWEGPFGIDGELSQRRRLPLLPGASAASSGVAAFVQNRRTGEVLQALLRSAC